MTRIIVLLLLTVSLTLMGQKGEKFPEMETRTMKDKKVILPDDVGDKYTLAFFAYSKKTEEDLKSWMQPLYDEFVGSSMWDVESYDINLKFVAMITGIKRAASGKIKKELKKGVDPELYKYLLVYEGSLNDYKDKLDFGDKDHPYYCLIDKEGNIVFSGTGKYSKENLKSIKSRIPADTE